MAVGFGLAFAANAAPLLLTELSYPTQRGKITAIYNTSWYIGSIVAAWTCFAAFETKDGSMWSWKIPSIIQAVGSIIQVCLVWFIPESPRWLISRGYDSDAALVLARYHANYGNERDPLVLFELAQIKHALKMEKEIYQGSSWFSLFSTPGNRKRMRVIIAIALFSQWSGNGLVSFYINLVLEDVGVTSTALKAKINGGLQIWNFFAALTAALLVDRLGRRTLFITSNTGMFITFSMWTLTTALFNTIGDTDAAKGAIVFMFAFFLFYDIAYTPMLVAYTLEILPFTIRARGFAVLNMTVCLALAFNQFVNPVALDKIGWQYYLIYCGWLVVELAFIVGYIVETKGRTLEETSILFDGEGLPDDLVAKGGQAATTALNRHSQNSQNSGRSSNSQYHYIQQEKSRGPGGQQHHYNRDRDSGLSWGPTSLITLGPLGGGGGGSPISPVGPRAHIGLGIGRGQERRGTGDTVTSRTYPKSILKNSSTAFGGN